MNVSSESSLIIFIIIARTQISTAPAARERMRTLRCRMIGRGGSHSRHVVDDSQNNHIIMFPRYHSHQLSSPPAVSHNKNENERTKRDYTLNVQSTTMRYLFFALVACAVVDTACAFRVLPQSRRNPYPTSANVLFSKNGGFGNDIVPLVDNPFREVDIDLEKINDCANHFGKYPVKEIEKMRDGEPISCATIFKFRHRPLCT
jgi:hypothetical protein